MPIAAAAALRTGDILAISAGVVVRVDPGTGAVSAFSPRVGSGPNLLSSPSDITSDAEGEVFVIDLGKLIQIDTATGAQHEVRAFNPQVIGDYPLDLGVSPWGVATSPIAPSGLNGRGVFVGSHGALYEVVRDAFNGTYTLVFGSFDSGWENYLGQSVSIEDLGGGNVAAWVGTYSGVLEGTGTPLAALYTEGGASILGTRWVGGVTYVSRVFGVYCSDFPADNGVYALSYDSFISTWSLHMFVSGGDLSCPGPIAAQEQPFALYVTDRSQTPNRIVKVTGLLTPQTSFVATMPGSQVISSLTVYMPEPASDLEGGAALTALLALVVVSCDPAAAVLRRAAGARSQPPDARRATP
jgi:hypothetical protein